MIYPAIRMCNGQRYVPRLIFFRRHKDCEKAPERVWGGRWKRQGWVGGWREVVSKSREDTLTGEKGTARRIVRLRPSDELTERQKSAADQQCRENISADHHLTSRVLGQVREEHDATETIVVMRLETRRSFANGDGKKEKR